MAYIAISDTTPSSVSLYLGGLDTSWNDGTRTANWSLWNDDTSKSYTGHTIANGVSSSSVITISGLEPDTKYSVTCRVYHGSTLLATISGYVTTDEEQTSWYSSYKNIGTISDTYNRYFYAEEYTLYYHRVVFENSGTATFYCDSSLDTVAFLSTKSTYNTKTGKPSNIIASGDDENGSDFSFTYDVTAGTPYYVFVRCYYTDDSGYLDFYIEPPEATPTWSATTTAIGQLSSDYSITTSLSAYTLRRFRMTFAVSGTATFYTSSSLDTLGYLSTKDTFDSSSGEPTSILASGDDYNSDRDFRFTYNVTAGTTYYLFVRCYSETSSGSPTVYIEVPTEKISVTKWGWSISNGNASASLTSNAYYALVNKTAVTNFSYLVWNDLVDKVKEILDATNDSWDSSYASYASTKMTSSNKTLTATKFNSLRYNIGSHYSTGISDKVSGEPVYGDYILTLATCINGWIDGL